MTLEEKRKVIEGIYTKHSFEVHEWTDALKCRVVPTGPLCDECDTDVQARIEVAWEEIDAAIHELN